LVKLYMAVKNITGHTAPGPGLIVSIGSKAS
jgi:hypothetical protein